MSELKIKLIALSLTALFLQSCSDNPTATSFTTTLGGAPNPTQSSTPQPTATPVGTLTTPTAILCPNAGQIGNFANCASTPTLAFGKQGIHTTSAPLTISVNNCSTADITACNGTGTLMLDATYYSLSGTNAADFTVTNSGSCAANASLASGSHCSVIVTFTPSGASGTNETATLTIHDNASTSTQTIALTGTSATVTLLTACQALSANTNYQLSNDVSASASCFTVNGSNTDLNLNGHTLTYCTANQSSLVGGVFMTGFGVGGTTVHNGTINEGAGACTGLAPSSLFGSGAVIASSDGSSSSSYGTSLYNLSVTIKAKEGKVLWDEISGQHVSNSTTLHDVIYTDNDTGTCGSVGCRAEDQFYPIVVDQSGSAGPSIFYNVIGTGGTQGAIVTSAAHSQFTNNFISPGNSTSTVTNGFIFQDWGISATISGNLTTGTAVGGGCLSCRGVQVSSANNIAVTGSVVQNNVLYTSNLNNNLEYNGCQIDGSYGMQINTADSGYDLSNNLFLNNKVVVSSSVCPGFGFSWSGATAAAGPNQTVGNLFACNLASGYTAGPCAGMRLDANEYNPGIPAVVGSGDTYLGDTSAIYIYYDGTPTWTCKQCTFGKGSNPISGWVMLDYDGGFSSGSSSDPMYLIDPTFTGGATQSSNNLAMWASNNHSYSFSYTVQWTYTVTAKGSSSGQVLAGAAVSIRDTQTTQECSGTTDTNGNFSCVLNDSKYAATTGTYSVTSYNPFAVTISKSGCTTLNYSKTVTSTTSETKTLPGC